MTEPSTALSICRNRTQILRLLWLILFAVYALFAPPALGMVITMNWIPV
ncbi:MAG: hypothetical protein IPO00_03220 [Betaproteobacteria bacterium]|nr:hypothetical protein [Betaproteobacteria bacterium]